MITVTGLWKSFGARDLFRGADLQVWARDRVAVVGPNGTGKTTLFEMIAGEQSPDDGEIRLAKDAVVGFLRQETDDLRGRSLLDEVVSVGSEVTAAGHRLEVLAHEIAECEPGPDRDRLVAEYGRLQDRFSHLGGYSLEADAKKILGGLGFKDTEFDKRTETFSGGWLMRIALAKLLLASPDVLMLDEPTNHLDVESVEWLERFLGAYDGAVLLISHDRDFINALATKVVEIDDRRLVSYTGDYADFIHQRALAAEQVEAAARNRARKAASTQAFIDRFRYKASKAKQVQSRIKALERSGDVATAPSRGPKKMSLAFPTPPRAGRVVVELEDVRFGYEKTPVYEALDVAIERDQRSRACGPERRRQDDALEAACRRPRASGRARKLGHNVALGYFAQHQIEALTDEHRAEGARERDPSGSHGDARNLLGRFLFSGDEAEKPVGVLSGGERTRLALAKLLVSPVNVLCLDEPTNHLDMWSRDVLEDALTEYEGAIVLITHDRHLIRNVANRIIEVVGGHVTIYDGDYDFYLARRERAPQESAADQPPEPTEDTPTRGKERRRLQAETRAKTKDLRDRIRKIEGELETLSAELTEMAEVLGDSKSYSEGADIAELSRRYDRARKRTEQLEAAWLEATESLEAASN